MSTPIKSSSFKVNTGDISVSTVNKLTVTQPANNAILTISDGKTFTAKNSLTIQGTDNTTMTFPSTSDTVTTLSASQTITNKNIASNTNKFGIISPVSDSTTAIQVQSTTGTNIVQVDTTNNKFIINNCLGLPKLTTVQRLALTGLSSGEVVYDTDLLSNMQYIGNGNWCQM